MEKPSKTEQCDRSKNARKLARMQLFEANEQDQSERLTFWMLSQFLLAETMK